MRKLTWLIVAGVIVLSFAFIDITSAATLTYLSGELVANADAEWTDYDYNSGSQNVSAGAYSGGTKAAGNAGASMSLSPGSSSSTFGISMSFGGTGGTGGVGIYTSNPGNDGFILFRVDMTLQDTKETGKIYYSADWHVYYNYPYASVEPLTMIINGTYKLAGTYGYGGSQESSGTISDAFDVKIGDIIGIKCAAGGGSDGIGNYQGDSSCRIELKDFSPVPLPPSVWLFGSGLLGLVGWRGFRKS